MQGRELGFDGKTLIHPGQVERRQRGVRPERARPSRTPAAILAGFGRTAAGTGVVTYNGRMIENLHVDNARRVLAIADAIAART